MARLTPFFLLAPLLALPASGAAQPWVPLGPPGGDVRSLAADPADPRLVYLGTVDGVLYRSTDAGERWERTHPGFPERGMSLDDLVVGPEGTLYVGYWEVDGPGGGVARSRDRGLTFTVLRGLQGQGVRALAQAPGNPRVLVAGTLQGIFRSEDEGETWRRISPEGHAEIRNVNSVALDPRDSRVVYAGTWHLPWKTSDAGESWRPVRKGMIDDSDVMTMNVDRRDPETVYATACSGIYRSHNGGALWSRIRGIPSSSRRTRAFAQDPAQPGSLFAGTTEGLFTSDDGSQTWRLLTGKDLVVNAVLLLPGGTVLLGTDGVGVLKSSDRGRTFRASNQGFSARFVSGLAVGEGGRLFAAIGHDKRHGGVMTAPGPEGPWAALGAGLEGREVLSLAVAGTGVDQEVFAGTDDGLFAFAAHCGAWRRLPTTVAGVETHPRVVHLAVASTGLIAAGTPRGLLLSRDGGERWEQRVLGLAAEVTGVALSSTSPAALVASTTLGVFWSGDLGREFRQVSNGVSGASMRGLRFLPGDPRVLFATTSVGLLRSADAGTSWSRHGGGLPLSDITGLAFAAEGTVFASDFGRGGVYKSADGGVSWSALPPEGLSGERVWALAVGPGSGLDLVAATAASGLRRLESPAAAPAAAPASR